MTYTRISLTIPSSLLRELDQRARSHGGRARSRLVAAAVREYLEQTADGRTGGRANNGTTGARVAQETRAPYRVDFDRARLDLLKANLALSPAERLKHAEGLLRLAPVRSRRHQVLAFDSYDDYYEWKKTRNVR